MGEENPLHSISVTHPSPPPPGTFVPWSVDLLMAMNLAPSSDADFFLASAKASSVPRGVAVMSGMRKVSTEPICFPLTHSSCSMVTSGCTCVEGRTP